MTREPAPSRRTPDADISPLPDTAAPSLPDNDAAPLPDTDAPLLPDNDAAPLPDTDAVPSPGSGVSPLTLSSVRTHPERQPGNRLPAPDDLRLVQALINSFHDLDTGHDRFATPVTTAAWMIERGLLDAGARLDERDRRRVVAVREGLQALAFANNREPIDQDAIDRLNRALRGPGLSAQLLATGRPDFAAAGRDLDSALALIATIVAVSQLEGRWSRLKACPGHDCGWAFYDHSRNQASSWCSMSVCGQRAKAREYRRRRRS